MSEEHSIKAVVTDVSPRGITLDVGGQTLQWPRHALPEDLRQGDQVSLRLLTERMEYADRQEQARAILSEILGAVRD